MNKNPVVSVLMPIGRDREYLKTALASIHQQTLKSFEILLGENKDGSITKTLNNLVKKARGDFLARMDSDDVSEPDRFRKQVEFLRRHPAVKLVGTSATLIDEKGEPVGTQKMPVSWQEIKRMAFFKNPLIHPSWMMRRSWFERIGGYNDHFLFSQDWELILRRVWKDEMVNFSDRLLRLRIHRKSLSFRENRQQVFYGFRARLEAIRRRDVPFRYAVSLLPSVVSFFVPTKIKFALRSR